MALPNSGSISLADIQTEFGGSNPIGLNEYYRNGSYVTPNNTNIPTSGLIDFNDFYGAETATFIAASGGSVSTQGDYKVHTFTSSGTMTFSQVGNAAGSNTVEYLVVGGGGKSQSGSPKSGGQGGKGGNGQASSISGSSVTYAGGGGGHGWGGSQGGGSGGGGQGNSGSPGSSNRGGGGGGKWGYPSGSKGSGGSGIVIIKYKYQ